VSVLELNLRAKRVAPQPAPAPPFEPGQLVIEVGKCYLTNGNVKVGPMHICAQEHYAEYGWLCAPFEKNPKNGVCYWDKNGLYIGQGKTGEHSFRREWTSTWELEEAWMAGKKLEFFYEPTQQWMTWPHHSYAVICNVFGANTKSAKEWWALQYHHLVEQNLMRVKP
jgi:hypothetical protein